jgi:hypothetical protein
MNNREEQNDSEIKKIKKTIGIRATTLVFRHIIYLIIRELKIFDLYFFNQSYFKLKLFFQLRWYILLTYYLSIYYFLLPIVKENIIKSKILNPDVIYSWYSEIILGILLLEIYYIIFFKASFLYRGFKNNGLENFRKEYLQKNQ